MLYSKKISVTAVLMTAVTFLALIISGCCTSRDIGEVKARLANLERQNRTTENFVNRLDSLLSQGAEADTKLRNELRFSVDELQQQMTTLLTNYNDLMVRINSLIEDKPVTHVIYSSPGAQADSAAADTSTATLTPPSPGPAYAIDCDSAYDESFINVRRGEYEKGVESLLYFLKNCPAHPNDENAHYWLGESYYSLNKYKEAAVEFEYVMNNYPNSVNIDLVLFKLARSKQELGQNKEAKELYQRLADEYPGTLKGEEAKERLKDFK
ncbi:MAG: tol-pal system protein YbgF [candidate division Zixibacteria bacterium]|nr:tol-pal system protein YbgF [candidate division Zixibacteria bacterium]